MNDLINEQREKIAQLERINDGLMATIEANMAVSGKIKAAAVELGYFGNMPSDELDYLIETARAVVMVNSKNLELCAQLQYWEDNSATKHTDNILNGGNL
jgi:hypothetical protein